MKTFLGNFFRENTAESMTRLLFFMGTLNSILISWASIAAFVFFNKNFFSEAVMLSTLFLGAGATTKILQKGKENGNTNSN